MDLNVERSIRMFEFLIGTRFYYKGKLVEVKENLDLPCSDCILNQKERICTANRIVTLMRGMIRSLSFSRRSRNESYKQSYSI